MLRGLAVALGATVTGSALYVGVSPERRLAATRTLDGGSRFVRVGYHAARVGLDYKLSLRGLERHTPAYDTKIQEVHERAATRLLHVCKTNGGVYTKAGQYIASMNHVLPPVFTDRMSVLQDKAAHKSFEEVQEVIERELGVGAIEEHFTEIDSQPIASASLAQVHRAVMKNGREVAVKIQYPGLESQVRADMFTMRVMVKALAWAFPGFEFSWMLPEFDESLELELDFGQEVRNSKRVAAMFSHETDVHIPEVVDELSSRRVIVMEFIRGGKVNDRDYVESIGATPLQVAAIVSRFFSDQIFYHGLLHCDPHAGNLMIRKDAQGKLQLVVLDHGMYRRLEPDFRQAYCRLWRSMMLTDAEGVREASTSLGVGEFADVLPLMLIFRPVSSGKGRSRIGQQVSRAEMKALKEKYKDTKFEDVNKFMEALPRDMLFVMRSTNLVRSLNKELGGTTRQRLNVMGESAIRGLTLDKAYNSTSGADTTPAQEGEHSPGVEAPLGTIFDKRRINQSVDSELVSDGAQRGWRATWRMAWDLGRMRLMMRLLDAWFGFQWWWHATEGHQHPRRTNKMLG